MTMGPGKYDEEAILVKERTKASGVIIIILGGNKGHGFSAQLDLLGSLMVPRMLRDIADQIEEDMNNVPHG